MKKVAEMKQDGIIYEVIKEDRYCNPYRIRMKWYDCGWKTRTVVKYAGLKSAMLHLADITLEK